MHISKILNLEKYPIDHPDCNDYLEIIESVRASLRKDGCAVLPALLTKKGLSILVSESEEKQSKAYYSDSKLCNVYLGKENPNESHDHPQNIFMERSNGFITADLFDKDTQAYKLYHWKPLRDFLAACLGKDKLYIYADPISNMIVNLCKPGQTFNWHFDTNEFTITFLLKEAVLGGFFEYVPNLRTKDDECFNEVRQVLKGDKTRIKRLKLNAGDLQFFLGRYSLHRVTHNKGETDRLLLIQSFTEKPNVIGSPDRVKDLYGKIGNKSQKIDSRVRSDSLLD